MFFNRRPLIIPACWRVNRSAAAMLFPAAVSVSRRR